MDIAIIGAGLAGLTLANTLKDIANVKVFEKARGVSGRLSTRRAEPFAFDHGAQYFTARSEAFKTLLAPLIDTQVIQRWPARHCDIERGKIIARHDWSEGEPRYVGAPKMSAMARALAKDINVSLSTRVTSMTRDHKWHLHAEDDTPLGAFDWVLSTAPPPQTVQLFPDAFQHMRDLRAAQMLPCFAVMLGFDSQIDLGFDAAHIKTSNISWIADNSSKPGRPAQSAAMIHSSHAFAEENLETDREQIIHFLTAEASKITGVDLSRATHKAAHRWLYANTPARTEGPLMLDETLKLGVCGDWNGGGKVEGAFLSAYRLAHALKAQR